MYTLKLKYAYVGVTMFFFLTQPISNSDNWHWWNVSLTWYWWYFWVLNILLHKILYLHNKLWIATTYFGLHAIEFVLKMAVFHCLLPWGSEEFIKLQVKQQMVRLGVVIKSINGYHKQKIINRFRFTCTLKNEYKRVFIHS